MKPLIFDFIEEPKEVVFECELEYSSELNLSVLKGTNSPAIGLASLDTETFTKAGTEASDSDNDFARLSPATMDTMTGTLNNRETMDNDADIFYSLLDTMTSTRNHNETDDNDSDTHRLILSLATETFTEAIETSDADQ